MSRKALAVWLALSAMQPLCAGAAGDPDLGGASQPDRSANGMPPMNMTPEEMATMSQQPAANTDLATHAPDMSLDRPARSEHIMPPSMPGMDMDDASNHHLVWIENLEAATGTHNGGAWDAQGWYGGDFDKFWVKSEGEHLGGHTHGAKVEALWAHALLPFWDTQLGERHDFGAGPTRDWLAFGAQGIAPYWFDTEVTGYVGAAGRLAARLKSEYDLYLTERWVLKPEIELNAYGKPDRARSLGSGLAVGEFELRLRYEITRRLAPYAGFVYDRKFAGTALLAHRAGEAALDHRAVIGIDFFF